MMGIYGFKTKKELKAAIGKKPSFIETSMFGNEYKGDGSYTIVGPDPFKARNWYATVEIRDGVIFKVS